MSIALPLHVTSLRVRLISWCLAVMVAAAAWAVWNLPGWLGYAAASPVHRPAHSLFEMLLPI